MIRATEACEITGCIPSTLRDWHGRLGFLPREGRGWREYDLTDLLAVRVMVVLTSSGVAANEAVQLTHSLLHELGSAAKGFARQIAIGRHPEGDEWEAVPIEYKSRAMDVLDFGGDLSFVLNLKSITHSIVDRYRQSQGLPTLGEALAAGKATIIKAEEK